MKVLVTGGSGFLGASLVSRIIKGGHEAVVLDLAKGNNKAQYVKGDVRNIEDVMKAAKGCGMVFHLAGLTDVRANDDMDYAVNFLGAKNVFDVARDSNAKVVFTSSAAIYGEAKPPVKENSACKPISQYGKSKLRAERLLGEDDLILRLFNVYGPNGKSVVNTFCSKVPKYEDITIYGSGMQTRDYIYVDDVIDALMLGFALASGTYNIGTGVETKLLDVLDIINKLTRARPSARFQPPKANEIKRSVADITKIRSIGWRPKISIEEGIRRLLNIAQ